MNKKNLACLLLIFVVICVSIYTYKRFTSGIDAVSSYSSSSDEDADITLHLNVITNYPMRDFEKCSKKIIECFKNNSFKTILLSYSFEQHPTHLIATVYQNRKAIDNGNVLFVLYYDSTNDTFEIK
ncbi:hypothetical protein DW106_05505 [Ruminococcus sp. AM09-18-1]|nr:hypothetical protein DW106_05505 [Ruminococcus sp. AM09-18-1]